MKKYVCDNCGKNMKKLIWVPGHKKLLGITGTVEKTVPEKGYHGNKVARVESEFDFELCSKKCFLNYIRKKL